MAHDPKALQVMCAEASPPGLELSFKPMFGGIMGYAGGKVFASLSDAGLALKLSGQNREDLLALPGSKPLQYDPDQPPSKSYVLVPAAMLSNVAHLRAWLAKSVAGLAPTSSQARKKPPKK